MATIPPSKTTHVKKEPLELTNTHPNNPPSTHAATNPPPPFSNSLADLRNLFTALSTFHRRYDDLQRHLDFIQAAIDSKLPKHLVNITPPPPQNQSSVIPSTKTTPPPSESTDSERKPNNTDTTPSLSELEMLCEMMSSRGLRLYLASHRSAVNKLREEAPKALRRARDPAKLVIKCFGRFFFQGAKAYAKDTPMIPAREASILVLEIFMLMGCDGVEIEPSVKEEAENSAMEWRKRLMAEGGLTNACEIDARGLLLLIGCFGIPDEFKSEDVRDLILSCNAREISAALRRSSVLLARVPEIIEGMAKNKMEIEAVDIAFTFGVECFAETILTSFLRKSEEAWKTKTKGAQGSFAAVNEANKKRLADLKSVIKCLENHKIDPSKLLRELQNDEKLLEKEISDLNEKMLEKERLEREISNDGKKMGMKVKPKRKIDETESPKKLKTSQFADQVPQQQKDAAFADGKKSNDGLTQMNFVDGGFPGAGSFPHNIGGSIAGSGGGLPAAGVGSNLIEAQGSVLPTGSYAGFPGGMLVDTVGQMANHNSQLYGRHGNAAMKERSIGLTFTGQPLLSGYNNGLVYGPSPSLEGFAGLPNHTSVGMLGGYNNGMYGPSPSLEGIARMPNHPSVGVSGGYNNALYGPSPSLEGFAGLPDHPLVAVSGRYNNGLYRSSPSLEGFAGLPNHPSSRSSGSNLYQFADAVAE